MRIASLALAFALLAAWSSGAKTPLPTFPERSTYPTIRARLVAQGYTPLVNGGQNIGSCEDHPDLCHQFPELVECIDNAGSDCSYLWKTPDGGYMLLVADSCCDQWVQPPKLLSEEDAKEILAPRSQEFPHFSRKLHYAEVRKRLVAMGYEPQVVTKRPDWVCAYSYKDMCRRYPEMIDCGNYLCSFVYRRPWDHRLIEVRIRSEGFGFFDIGFTDADDPDYRIKRPKRHH